MKVLLLLALFSKSVFAAFPEIDIKGVSGDYLDGKGKAYADKAYYVLPKVKIKHEQIDVTLNRKEKNLVIKDPSTTVELDFDFSFLNIFKSLNFENMNVKSDRKIFKLDTEQVHIFIHPKKYALENIFLATDVRNLPSSEGGDITVLDGIIFNGALEFSKMSFPKFDPNFLANLSLENPEQNSEVSKLMMKQNLTALPVIVRRAKFLMNKGRFIGRAYMDSYINLWLKVYGTASSNKDNTELIVHLETAKLGIFSIKSTLLKQMKKLNLDNVRVERDKIIFNLDGE